MACDCENDPIECLRQMFVDQVQQGRIDRGQNPARRPVFLRLHGVAHATLSIEPHLAPELRVGLFAEERSFPAWVRLSSDVPDSVSEQGSTCGIAIKLFDVPGARLPGLDPKSSTVDLLFQNHDVFFVDDAQAMCSFTQASLAGKADEWLKDHPKTAGILHDMKKEVRSTLDISYFSVIPFRFGANQACKMALLPEAPDDETTHERQGTLAQELHERLVRSPTRFKCMVQLSNTLPTDELTVRWPTSEAPFHHVATLELPRQDIASRGQAEYGENLAFNPWRTLEAHEPLGSIAQARKVAYAASADLRRDTNGTPRGEPEEPRPPHPYPDGDARIVRCAIHPAIGVARVGNSEEGWFIGPEVAEPPPAKIEQHRDPTGKLKRQAARFRVYGYDAQGRVVRELTASDAQITWQVELANLKAQWFQFDRALDIPEAVGTSVPLRNASITNPEEREQLAIRPGPRSISGASAAPQAFDSGKFQGQVVDLGELRTDPDGRLIVLGGRGKSGSPQGLPIRKDQFNNVDGWYDDTSDGPVSASVVLGGRSIACEPAWVVVAPPNYAPDVKGWRTMYDLRVDVARREGLLPLPECPSFTHDILPILQRLSGLQWVNAGFASFFGFGGALDFESQTDLIRKLANPPTKVTSGGQTEISDPYQELRRTITNSFRRAMAGDADPGTWPWIYGDGFGTGPTLAPSENLELPTTWAWLLDQWVEGDFIADWDESQVPARHLDEVPTQQQPAMLDRAALDFCLADAFHPGCELTWPMRHQSMFTSPLRIRHAEGPAPSYGDRLTPEIALSVGGPLYGQRPGDLTRWMALPWQMDTAFCRSGYDTDYDPYLPTFWPARVPNQVLSKDDYEIATDRNRSRTERIAAFHDRSSWLRQLPQGVEPAAMWMVEHFDRQGIVVRQDGATEDPELPRSMWVEMLHEGPDPTEPSVEPAALARQAHSQQKARVAAAATGQEARVARAGWTNRQEAEEAGQVYRRGR